MPEIAEFMSVLYGEEVTKEQVADIGWECLQDEWEFNAGAGFTAEDDDLPTCVREEGVGPGGAMKFDVEADVIAQVKANELEEIDPTQACRGHGHHGGRGPGAGTGGRFHQKGRSGRGGRGSAGAQGLNKTSSL